MKKYRFLRLIPLLLLTAALWTCSAPASAATELFDYDKKVEEIVDLADPEWSDVDKALFFYQYLTENFTYDDNLLYGAPAELYATGKGTCDAFSEAYMDLLHQADIPCERVTSDPMDHAWNLVELDGKWYHADPTRDIGGGVRHFLKSDWEFEHA